jgi:hypothetical protein
MTDGNPIQLPAPAAGFAPTVGQRLPGISAHSGPLSILLRGDTLMFTFFLKHKIFSALLICGVAYFFVNPPHKFGFITGSLVVYNRIPLTHFDLFIDFDGSMKPMTNMAGADEQKDWMSSILETPREDVMLLVVGTGFGRSSFHLSDSLVIMLEVKGIHTVQVPSPEAAKQYNAAVDHNTKVAILLSMRH